MQQISWLKLRVAEASNSHPYTGTSPRVLLKPLIFPVWYEMGKDLGHGSPKAKVLTCKTPCWNAQKHSRRLAPKETPPRVLVKKYPIRPHPSGQRPVRPRPVELVDLQRGVHRRTGPCWDELPPVRFVLIR